MMSLTSSPLSSKCKPERSSRFNFFTRLKLLVQPESSGSTAALSASERAISVCDTTPTSLPLLSRTGAPEISFSVRNVASSCRVISSLTESTFGFMTSFALRFRIGTPPMKILCWFPLGHLRKSLQGNFVAEGFQSADEMALEPLPMQLIKVVRSQVLIGLLALEDVVGAHQEAMSDGHNGSLLSAASRQAVILRRQIAVLGVTGTMGRLRQCTLQPAVAFAGLATLALTSTFLVSRTESRPGGQMLRCRKAVHVESDLRHQGFSRLLVHSRNRVQQRQLLMKRAQTLPNLLAQ